MEEPTSNRKGDNIILLAECSVSMLEDDKAILPSEAGQPDEDDFATIPLQNKVAKIKFTKPSEVTSLQVRGTDGLDEDDTVSVTVTFVNMNEETKTTVSMHCDIVYLCMCYFSSAKIIKIIFFRHLMAVLRKAVQLQFLWYQSLCH